ncbi:hypothetical protein G9A89_023761 [Geosiphon pyriformis]|nr:hypothetical protein G9A89_023761 [Geosiphon pyriformis]
MTNCERALFSGECFEFSDYFAKKSTFCCRWMRKETDRQDGKCFHESLDAVIYRSRNFLAEASDNSLDDMQSYAKTTMNVGISINKHKGSVFFCESSGMKAATDQARYGSSWHRTARTFGRGRYGTKLLLEKVPKDIREWWMLAKTRSVHQYLKEHEAFTMAKDSLP